MKCFTKSEKQRRYNDQILDYFFIKIPTRGRHHLLPKIHKRLYNVYMKPVISISEYYAEMISAFHEYHCKPTAQKIKSHVKGTNDFFTKIRCPSSFTKRLYFVYNRWCEDNHKDYPVISYNSGLVAMWKALDFRIELVQYVFISLKLTLMQIP